MLHEMRAGWEDYSTGCRLAQQQFLLEVYRQPSQMANSWYGIRKSDYGDP